MASKPTIDSEDELEPIEVPELRFLKPKESDSVGTARALWALVDKVKGLSAMRKAELAELKGIHESLQKQRQLMATQVRISAVQLGCNRPWEEVHEDE